MANHTKIPWYVGEKARWQADVRFVRTSDDKSGVIGCCGDDDAEFIVQACNSFDALLDALQDAQQALAHAIHVTADDPSFATSIALKGAEEKARMALVKATG